MGEEIADLLRRVSGQLDGVERVLGNMDKDHRELRAKYTELLTRVAVLERDEVWTGKERRKVDQRLGTGDHTFKRIEAKAGAAWDLAEDALELAQELKKLVENLPQKETGIRHRVKKLALEAAAPVIAVLLLQILYHVLMFGPKIAALMKAAEGVH